MQELKLAKGDRHVTVTYQVMVHVGLAIIALVTALVFRQPAALVLGAPSLVILLTTLLDPTVGEVKATVAVEQPRALEGDTVTVTVTLESASPVAVVDVELVPSGTISYEGPIRAAVSLGPGQPRQVSFDIVVRDWGVVQLGSLMIQTWDRFGLVNDSRRIRIVDSLRVHIAEAPVRSLMEPNRFRRLVGSHLSQERGGGCEIADIRPYQPGDRLQSLNWRISARNDEPWITLRHPDRSTTIVLLLDAFQVYGQHRGDTFRRSIRATLGLARLHIGAQDPVGLMLVGTGIRWFPPSLGGRHLHVMTDALLDLSTSNWAKRVRNYHQVERLVPKDAVVVAISPLKDPRFVRLLTDLRIRGQSLHVIEPFRDWPSYRSAVQKQSFGPDTYSRRIMALDQQLRRRTLTDLGASVLTWDEHQPFESMMLGLRIHQRAQRSVRT